MTGAETPLGAAPAAGLARRWQLLAWLLLAALLAVGAVVLVRMLRKPAPIALDPGVAVSAADAARLERELDDWR